MNTTVYLVRHAEVENPNDIEYMRLPGFGLSNYGLKQAQRLAEIFREKNIDSIYASPLKRTRETAQIIAGEGKRVNYRDNLLEVDYKKWQGVKRSERKKEELEGYQKNPVKYSAILGESLLDIQHRVNQELFEIIEKNKGKNIVIVTHAAPIITTRLFFENRSLMDFQKITTKYGSVTTIVFDDELQCKSIRYNEYVSQREGQNER